MRWFYEDMSILGVFQDPIVAERAQTEWKQLYGMHNGWIEIREEIVK
jgi:hypothetical protein